MKICWVIDNKYRDLYGLYDLKKNLKQKNLDLCIINKYHWLYALKYFNPHYVIIPNIYKTSGLPILEFCIKNDIRVILYNVEGFHTDKKLLKIYFQKKYLKDLYKIYVWSPQEVKYLIKVGYPRSRIVLTGALKLQTNKQKKFPKKIKKIGIISTNKFFSGRFVGDLSTPIMHHIYRKKPNKEDVKHTIGFMHYEIDFLNLIKNIIFATKKKYEFIVRPHPFEDSDFYVNPHFKLDQTINIHDFLNNVDVVLNHYSSASLDALIYNVPTISLEHLLKKSYKIEVLDNFFPKNLAYKPKNMNELLFILNDKNFLSEYKKIHEKKFKKIMNKKHPIEDGITRISNSFDSYKKNKKFNYFKSIIMFAVYELYYFIKYNRDTAYKLYFKKDRKLLKEFSTQKNNGR